VSTRDSQLSVLPDAVRLVSSFLRAQPEIRALVGDRVYSKLPPNVEFPAVRLVQWTERPLIDEPLWLVTPGAQVDCWAGTKYLASTVARTTRAVLSARLVAANRDTISGVRFGTLADAPDPDYEPALARFRFDLFVTIHPSRRAEAPLVENVEPEVPADLSA
jgi:hypothetical protein